MGVKPLRDPLLSAFAESVRTRDGLVLAFRVRERELVSREQLLRTQGLHVVATLEDGEVFDGRPRIP